MISEVQELRVKGGWHSHFQWICVVCDGYGGFGGRRDEGGGWHACGTKPGDWSHVGRCREIGRMSGDAWAFTVWEVVHWWHPIASSSRCAVLGSVESELVGLSGRHEKAPVVVVSSPHQSLSWGVSRFLTALYITIPLSVWSASKSSRKGGGCHEANDHSCGNGCALSGRLSSCTDHGFGCDRCAVVPV